MVAVNGSLVNPPGCGLQIYKDDICGEFPWIGQVESIDDDNETQTSHAAYIGTVAGFGVLVSQGLGKDRAQKKTMKLKPKVIIITIQIYYISI